MVKKQAGVLVIIALHALVLTPLFSVGAQEGVLTENPIGIVTVMNAEATGGEASQEEPLFKTEDANTKPWYKKWWVWTIAGAVVVGIVAAAGGGGGGGGGPATEPVTISGPIP